MKIIRKYPDPEPGTEFGMLTVISGGCRRNDQPSCLVRCQCGTEKIVTNAQLRTLATVSCGCKRKNVLASQGVNNARHGKTRGYKRTSEWNIWAGILQRCCNPRNRAYSRYGGRGIKVATHWLVFENFLADMGERPSDDLSIDRVDPDGNYEPSNCRWATRMEQRHNRSTTLMASP